LIAFRKAFVFRWLSPCKDRPLIPLVRRTCLTAEGGPCLRLLCSSRFINMSKSFECFMYSL
jgi:hypothetical protein